MNNPTFLRLAVAAACAGLCLMPLTTQAADHVVEIVNFEFVPEELTIQAGDTVTWIQRDSAVHTTTSGADGQADGLWDSGNMTRTSNTTFSFTFTEPGTYPYFCIPHRTFMRATVTVEGAPTPTPVTSAIARAEAGVNVMWEGGAGPYSLQLKSDLRDPLWSQVAATAGSSLSVPSDGRSGFFRVVDLAEHNETPMTVWMTGAAERPDPVTTDGQGFGNLTLEGNRLAFNIRYEGLSGPASAAHIHGPAAASESAGVLVNLAPFNGGSFGASGTLAGVVDLTDEQRDLVFQGKTYVNIHTANHGSGEIRGQIAPVLWETSLSGANERPNPVSTSASGSGLATLVGNELSFNVTYRDLTGAATGAHIHGPAGPEESTGVLVSLEQFNGGSFGASGRLSGTVELTPDQLAAFIDGRTYVNIHTSAHGSGEIRGQLQANPTAVPLTAWISGAAERPDPVGTRASGGGTFALEGNQLAFDISYAGLSGPATAAHIHGPSAAEESAGVMINLADFNGGAFGNSGTLSGSVDLTPEQRAAVLSGKTYVNFHTEANGAGEIRGQIAPVLMKSSLSGASERPDPVESTGSGFGILMLVGDSLRFNSTYGALSADASAAHIHGPADRSDSTGVLINLEPYNGGAFAQSGSLAGKVELTAEQLRAVLDGRTYINVHTSTHGSGEIRGQITR